MLRSRKNWLPLTAALFLFAILHSICAHALSEAAFIEVLVELDHRDRLQVFYSSGGDFKEQHSSFSAMIEPWQQQTVRIPLHSVSAQRLRLDLGEKSGKVRLYRMTVVGTFAKNVVLAAPDIFRHFNSHAENTEVRLQKDAVVIQTSEDSYIVCQEPLLQPNLFLLYSLPPFFALLAFFFLQQIDFSQLAPFADLRSKKPSVGENINALDGLRALALLMVVADHTWGWFSGTGRSGVWVFMTLSGFLLAKPFVQQPARALSFSFLRHFFTRRIKRILPIYYTYVSLEFLLQGRLEEAALHFLFLKGSGHLWVVPQEMLFYLLTPFLMLFCLLLFRIWPWLIILGLVGLIALAKHFDEVILLLGGLNGQIPLYFGVFLGGVLASWLYYGFWKGVRLGERARQAAATMALLILLFFLLFSHEKNGIGFHLLTLLHLSSGQEHRFLALAYYPWFAAAATVLILAVLVAGNMPSLRFLSSLPLRALSLVSFSVYIFHTLIIDILRKGAELYFNSHLVGAPLFILTLVWAYFFACITYSLIERPFLRSA